MKPVDPSGAIVFAEKALELLDDGRYTATYKFAVLLALIDLCLESTRGTGQPPDVLTTRQLAEKVIEIYWAHATPFAQSAEVLRQNVHGQAEILSDISRFRETYAPEVTAPRWQAVRAAPGRYEQLVRRIEWKLIQMPLPRLQMIGGAYRAFIYDVHWNERVRRGSVADYQGGRTTDFDNRILLRPHVGSYLIQLNSLLRPLIQRRWAAMVASLNDLDDSRLESFLFGATRAQTAAIRSGLWKIQDERCFYCDIPIRDPGHACVDHFIPWSRYPDDGLDNLVATDVDCNASKRNALAAARHLARWARRLTQHSSDDSGLTILARTANWERPAHRSLNVARGIYLRLHDDARLWLRGNEFVEPHFEEIRRVLS